MSDDLVKRLREDQPVTQDIVSTMQCELQNEAADCIEELEAKLAKAVGALQNIAGKVPYADDPWDIACAALAELKGTDT